MFPDKIERAITFEKRVWEAWERLLVDIPPSYILWTVLDMAQDENAPHKAPTYEQEVRRCLRGFILTGDFMDREDRLNTANDEEPNIDFRRWN